MFFFFFSSRRRHTRFDCDWSSDVCSSDLGTVIWQDPPPGLSAPAGLRVTLVASDGPPKIPVPDVAGGGGAPAPRLGGGPRPPRGPGQAGAGPAPPGRPGAPRPPAPTPPGPRA